VFAPLAVRVTELPVQILVADGVITTTGSGFTFTVTVAVVLQPVTELVAVTV
jgi:hypothetical protein